MRNETVAELNRAKESLRVAQENFDRERRQDDEQRLKDARAAGRQAKDHYDSCENKFRHASEEIGKLEVKFNALQFAIAQHNKTKPDSLDFPSDEELATWQRKADELAAELDMLQPELRNAHARREQYRQETMEAYNVLERQQLAVRNIENALSDPEGKYGAPRSSISWVPEL